MKTRRIEQIFYSSHFARALKSLAKTDLLIISEREQMFRDNCFHPSLRTHKLKGKLKKYWSFSITPSHRILFEFIDDHSVAFIDVGDHSIYK